MLDAKMDLISIEGYENANVICLKNKNCDLVLKEIYGAYGKKNLTKEEIKYYKMTEREFFKTFYDLDEYDLNTKSIFLLKILSWKILLKIVKVKKKRCKVSREF